MAWEHSKEYHNELEGILGCDEGMGTGGEFETGCDDHDALR